MSLFADQKNPQQIPQKLIGGLPYKLAASFLGIHSQELKTGTLNRYLYTSVHRSIILNDQKVKQYKSPSTDERINKMYYTYPMN